MDITHLLLYLLNGLLMAGMPVALAIYLTRRFHLGWRLFWLGAATFIISQVLHIPFNSLVMPLIQRGILPSPTPAGRLLFNAVFLGLSAGIFEETARYLVYRTWAADARSWRKGLLFGAGHGGVEAVITGLLALYSLVQISALTGADLSKVVPAGQLDLAQKQITAYWSAPLYLTMFGALERFFAIPTQIALSILVLQTFTRRKFFWYPLAVLYHALVDAVVVFSASTWGVNLTEALLGVFFLISVAIIFILRQPEPVEPVVEETPLPAPLPVAPREVPVTKESLDKSRYLG